MAMQLQWQSGVPPTLWPMQVLSVEVLEASAPSSRALLLS
jgi:hypothetical protein